MTTTKTNQTPGENTRFFSSWSGGKDSCLALHRAVTAGAKPAYLLTIISEDGIRSRSHGLRKDVLEAQASSMVLHDLNLASEYSHRLVLFNRGKVHKVGRAEEVIHYRIIEAVYQTIVVVEQNPLSSKPYVFVVSQEARETHEKQNNEEVDNHHRSKFARPATGRDFLP